MKDTHNIVVVVLGALVIAGAGFIAGRHTDGGFGKFGAGRQMMVAGENIRGQGGMFADREMAGKQMGNRGRGMMGSAGEVTSVEGNTITLKLDEETTKEVTLSGDTTVYTMTEGATGSIKVGQTIMVHGGGFWTDTETVIIRPQ